MGQENKEVFVVRMPSASNSVRNAASCSKSVMAPRGRFQRYPSSTTTPYHSNGTRTGVFAAYFTDGSYWRVLNKPRAPQKGRLHL